MSNINSSALENAKHFLENEKQFHLGMLPTEQPHPKTKGLDEAVKRGTAEGVRMMQEVDKDIIYMAEKIFSSKEFTRLVERMTASLLGGGKVVFSGCGATGRLSILLDAAWRKFWLTIKKNNLNTHGMEERVLSIMTGGDYALIRSVESFEDYISFGRRQAEEAGINEKDTLVAITEGGETSSVIGTAFKALEEGAEVFIAFNNPSEILSRHIERSKAIIEHPETTVLDLHTGQMAVAGSTRLQAVSSELLIVGAALEKVIFKICAKLEIKIPYTSSDPLDTFKKLVADLGKEEALNAISEITEFEEKIYSQGGLVTYFADNSLIDIFTDTTERAPTFMLPPFVKCDDKRSPQSWAFVKSPLYSTEETWLKVLGRQPQCLSWTPEDYRKLGASEKIINNPPKVDFNEILKFRIGSEPAPERYSASPSAATALLSASDFESGTDDFMREFDKTKKDFTESIVIGIGENSENCTFSVPCSINRSPLMLWEHIAVKLVMNTVSTLTMARMGRVKSNWMSWVEATNKKLIDRSSRLISELCEIPYEKACEELFITMEIMENTDWTGKQKPSPVQYTIERIEK